MVPRFQHTKLPGFDGTQDMIAAMRWISDVEGLFLHLILSGEYVGSFRVEPASFGSKGLVEVCDD